LTTTLQLLKAKRSSAIKDARKIEAQLARLNKSAEATGIKTSLRYVTRLFRDYIAALDETIKSAHTPRNRKNADQTA
jgi:chorismate mutase